MVNVKMTGLRTYDGTRTLDSTTSYLSTLHCHFRPYVLEMGLPDECGILLTNSWAAAELLQFQDKDAVWANHHVPVYASASILQDHHSAAVEEAMINSDSVTRRKCNSKSLQFRCGELISAVNECLLVRWHQMEPCAPSSNEFLFASYLFNRESNTEESKAVLAILGVTAARDLGLGNGHST